MHPAFPSGHSFLGHLIALLLLEIPAIAARYGVLDCASMERRENAETGRPGRERARSPRRCSGLRSVWPKNRERIGVHYPSDSMASRHLAQGLWNAMLSLTASEKTITCPTLESVLKKAFGGVELMA